MKTHTIEGKEYIEVHYPNGPEDYNVELVEKATVAQDNFNDELTNEEIF